MRMKSYFASSVQIAMEQARRELGGDAILVTSRLTPAEAGKTRQYEVIFAAEIAEMSSAEKARSAEGALAKTSADAKLDDIKGMRRPVPPAPHQSGTPSQGESSAAREMLKHLTSGDVDPDLAQQLVASALERHAGRVPAGSAGTEGRFSEVLRMTASKLESPAASLRSALAACIADVFRVDSGLSDPMGGPVAMAMIGPPGAGKTAALVRIAIRYGMGGRKSVLLISADNLRVAAFEQLRGYAAVLGLRFELAQSTRVLGQLIEDHRGYGLVLIDTPGFSGGESEAAGELAQFLAGQAGIQKHLVLPAPARCADMNRISSAYDIFHPTHLLFSRTDETTIFGPALSEAMGRGLPVSFFGTGSRIPEDLSEASADFIAERLLPMQPGRQTMRVAA